MFSCIRMGDGYLNLYDLYQMRLPSKLVTLSGCATGMNFVSVGDELLGLQRGLFCAGASSLLLSLWDVHDQSTSALMESFYKNYVAGQDLATALQDAEPLVAAPGEQRDRDPAVLAELLPERERNLARGRGDSDRVERGVLGKPA